MIVWEPSCSGPFSPPINYPPNKRCCSPIRSCGFFADVSFAAHKSVGHQSVTGSPLLNHIILSSYSSQSKLAPGCFPIPAIKPDAVDQSDRLNSGFSHKVSIHCWSHVKVVLLPVPPSITVCFRVGIFLSILLRPGSLAPRSNPPLVF